MSVEETAWMEFMTLGEPHTMLAKQVGDWKVVTKIWMQPTDDPIVSEAFNKSEMIFGGRYLKHTFSGSSMGMPIEGMGIDGYDNVKKKFVSYWIDSMGTGFAFAEGIWDEKTNSITMHGNMSDPVTGGESMYKMVITLKDNDHSVTEMFMLVGDKEIKNMEMEYTRVK